MGVPQAINCQDGLCTVVPYTKREDDDTGRCRYCPTCESKNPSRPGQVCQDSKKLKTDCNKKGCVHRRRCCKPGYVVECTDEYHEEAVSSKRYDEKCRLYHKNHAILVQECKFILEDIAELQCKQKAVEVARRKAKEARLEGSRYRDTVGQTDWSETPKQHELLAKKYKL